MEPKGAQLVSMLMSRFVFLEVWSVLGVTGGPKARKSHVRIARDPHAPPRADTRTHHLNDNSDTNPRADPQTTQSTGNAGNAENTRNAENAKNTRNARNTANRWNKRNTQNILEY